MNILGTDNKGFYIELHPMYMSMERALMGVVQMLINIGADNFSVTILGYQVSFIKELR